MKPDKEESKKEKGCPVEGDSIVAFTVHYRSGGEEKIEVGTRGVGTNVRACMLLVEGPRGVSVRGHGDDEGLSDLFDVFFSRNKSILTHMIGVKYAVKAH